MVLFNALQTTLSGGIGRYCYELSKAIYTSKEIEFMIIIREEDKDLFSFADDKDLIIIKGCKNGFLRNIIEQFYLPFIFNKYPKAIIHFPDSMCTFMCFNKIIITVHDIAFAKLKNVFKWRTRLWKKFSTWLSIQKAEKVISITKFTKNEIIDYYKIRNIDKISVVYNGYNNMAEKPIDISKVSNNIMQLTEKKYILTVSTISPRKNIDGLIKAFNVIQSIHGVYLIVAGAKGWMYESVFELVDKLNLKQKVIFTDKVNDDELASLYKYAKIFIYPSFYEGFGLPPLEAMSFGIPTAVSNVSSLPEVVGGSALMFNPYSIQDMKNTIEKLLLVDKIKKDSNKISKPCNKKFSWSKCAKNTIRLYKYF